MGESIKQMLQAPMLTATDFNDAQNKQWMIKEDDQICSFTSKTSSEDSTASIVSSSSELVEDASSLRSSSSIPSGPLYDLSELMVQLPIKGGGLSKYFEGKSQSFTSVSNVRCIEDLAKRVKPYRKKMKTCKSYADYLKTHRSYSPKVAISKKTARSFHLY